MAHLLREKLQKASFSSIKETGKKVPHSPWPKAKRMKEVGMCMMVNMTGLSLFSSSGVSLGRVCLLFHADIVSATVALFTEVLHWSPQQTNEMMESAKQDIKNTNMHIYSKMHLLTAQKPKSAQSVNLNSSLDIAPVTSNSLGK